MLDAIILLALSLLLLRGWTRGFVREAMDLVGLVLGTVLAFRMGPAVGAIIGTFTDLGDDVTRFVGGFVVFIGAGIGAAFATRAIEQATRLPGLNLMNRAGGAGLAAAWGLFLSTLVLTIGVVLPVPPAVADTIDDSAVARTLTDPDGLAQEVFIGLAGDRLIETVLNLREAVGARRVIVDPNATIEIGSADLADLVRDHEAALDVFSLVNGARVVVGVSPLTWSEPLADVAAGHAVEMYVEGYFSHTSPVTGNVGTRLETAGISYRVAGENLALAATVSEVHDGLMDSPGHRANIESPSFDTGGFAVVRGPLGLMTVQVFTG